MVSATWASLSRSVRGRQSQSWSSSAPVAKVRDAREYERLFDPSTVGDDVHSGGLGSLHVFEPLLVLGQRLASAGSVTSQKIAENAL